MSQKVQTEELIDAVDVKKKLYLHLRKQAQVLTQQNSQGFLNYEKRFEKEFLGSWKAVENHVLFEALNENKLLFFADFHALNQSQKSHMRLLRRLAHPSQHLLLMECFLADHQSFIDLYLRGSLSEEEFLHKINWDSTWGFPWSHYQPIVQWAKQHKVPIVGLNRQVTGFSYKSLSMRDRFAAEKISELIELWGDKRKFVVIFGDHHLAKDHLPKEIFKRVDGQWRKRTLIVFQNVEEIFFKMLEKSLELTVDVVKLSGNRYVLQSVPPWVKWQHYLLFLEQKYDEGMDSELDYSDWVDQNIRMLSQELGLQMPPLSYEVDTIDTPQLLQKISRNIGAQTKKAIRFNIQNEVSFYLPEQQRAVLARPSINHAASLAMAIILSHLAQIEKLPVHEECGIYPLIWWEACSYFGSKIMNPKRKSLTAKDIKAQLDSSAPGALRKAVLQAAIDIKLRDYLFIEKGEIPKVKLKSFSLPVSLEVSKLLGSMMGEKLYFAFKVKYFSKKNFSKLLRQPLKGNSFQNFYFEMISLLNGLPEPFESKEEKL